MPVRFLYWLVFISKAEEGHFKTMELYASAAELGLSKAHFNLGNEYRQEEGNLKKVKF